MKHAFRLPAVRALFVAALALLFITNALIRAQAQTPGPTPDTFTAQITGADVDSFAYGISGNGRFVVIESTANLAPENPLRPTEGRNNADGNREIFLFDYAQRRVYQITNTKSALKDATKPRVDPAAPRDFSNIEVEVINTRPAISYDGKWIVFGSNAYSDADASANPKDFVGSSHTAALKADGNTEIFIYRVPDAPDVDLTSGAEITPVTLSGSAITRVTNTPASMTPTAGANGVSPTFADDNRFPAVNDDASVVAFISSRNILGNGSNSDLNPEVFIYNRLAASFAQLTRTANPANSAVNLVFNANPTLSADGSVITFISSADFGLNAEGATDRGGAEVFIANISGGELSNIRQVTRTPNAANGLTVNLLSYGRRMSRNGKFVLFETRADLNASGTAAATLLDVLATYLYSVDANSYTLVGPRPAAAFGGQFGDVQRFPTFTGDSSFIVFASALNFKADGTAPPAANSTDGLNPNLSTQLFATPVSAPTTFSRLTKAGATPFQSDAPVHVSETLRRLTFSYRFELGGGNTDVTSEAFYMLVPPATSETNAAAQISFFTGASLRPVVAATPAPSPSPAEAVTGLATGMLGVARATEVTLAPSERTVNTSNADERERRPPLPVELNGVSVSINGAAAGLYFVSPNQINFVVPVGLAASVVGSPHTVVINNNGAVLRTTLQVHTAQPDLLTTTNGPGGRVVASNVTDKCVATGSPEPPEGFPVTTVRLTDQTNCTGTATETVPTELLIMLTGVRGVTAVNQVTVTIRSVAEGGKTANATVLSVQPTRTAGFDQITVRLPADLAGAGESTVVVTVNINGVTFTSRPIDTAPRIKIQ